jgi:hypothetical protein
LQFFLPFSFLFDFRLGSLFSVTPFLVWLFSPCLVQFKTPWSVFCSRRLFRCRVLTPLPAVGSLYGWPCYGVLVLEKKRCPGVPFFFFSAFWADGLDISTLYFSTRWCLLGWMDEVGLGYWETGQTALVDMPFFLLFSLFRVSVCHGVRSWFILSLQCVAGRTVGV